MRSASIYACRSRESPRDRETLIFEQLDSALTARAEIERHNLARPDRKSPTRPRTLPGLATVRPREPIVALGCVAHTALADYEKRTLIAGDLDLGGPRQGAFGRDVEQFVWSCTTTVRIVALGAGAWRCAQLLPIADRRCHKVPPLRFADHSRGERSVLVIDHGADGARARMLVDILERAKMDVNYTGPSASGSWHDACWSSAAAIHVHVGDHTLDAEEPRLVDSWRSERLALQLAGDRRVRRAPDVDVLTIENEVNGIICQTPEEVELVCHELADDQVLRKKLIVAGQSTVAPLLKGWGAVADDLLS